ncbi:uncharacterized protein A4U43_C01F24260 [Asparagus officinalis]|uniref:Uncharacterized protein n=1 Tax=Asparagus officinalis TaxID=4686 RepID=A0A5P1FVA4_ASPOF|nr:uncharacterized protein A4U43_C01F24260 [Asparagus officinalis]
MALHRRLGCRRPPPQPPLDPPRAPHLPRLQRPGPLQASQLLRLLPRDPNPTPLRLPQIPLRNLPRNVCKPIRIYDPFAVWYLYAELPQRLNNRAETVDQLYELLDFVRLQTGDLVGAKASFLRFKGLKKRESVEFKNLIGMNKALEFVMVKDYVSAVREYEECIERDPGDVIALNNKTLWEYGLDLEGGGREVANLEEGQGVEGEVDEVLMGGREAVEGEGDSDLVGDRVPLVVRGEVDEGYEFVAEVGGRGEEDDGGEGIADG